MSSKGNKAPREDSIPQSTITQYDILQRIASVMRLLQQLDRSDALTPASRNKLYWIQLTLMDVVNHVNESLQVEQE